MRIRVLKIQQGHGMRVFIALAVGMSTFFVPSFFVPSAIGFPDGMPKQSDVEGVAGKTNRFPLLAMAPLPHLLVVRQ